MLPFDPTIIGIDPGLNGAIASWNGEWLKMFEMPAVKATGRGREIDWNVLYREWDTNFWEADHVFLERVGSRHGEGVSSAFKFGLVVGGCRGIIAARGLPVTLVTPGVWKKHYGIQASKVGAVIRASELFPEHAARFRGPRGGIKDGLAEAALIAKYGYDKLRGSE